MASASAKIGVANHAPTTPVLVVPAPELAIVWIGALNVSKQSARTGSSSTDNQTRARGNGRIERGGSGRIKIVR